jgi:hypothetical protein
MHPGSFCLEIPIPYVLLVGGFLKDFLGLCSGWVVVHFLVSRWKVWLSSPTFSFSSQDVRNHLLLHTRKGSFAYKVVTVDNYSLKITAILKEN